MHSVVVYLRIQNVVIPRVARFMKGSDSNMDNRENKSNKITVGHIKDKVTGRFVGGNVANPRGRPKIAQEIKDLALSYSAIALNKVMEMIDNPKTKDSDRIKAIEIILDRGLGKSVQTNVNENYSLSLEWINMIPAEELTVPQDVDTIKYWEELEKKYKTA